MLVVGALTMWGGISGNMPAMIAALVAPQDLSNASGSQSLIGSIVNAVTGAVSKAAGAVAGAYNSIGNGPGAAGYSATTSSGVTYVGGPGGLAGGYLSPGSIKLLQGLTPNLLAEIGALGNTYPGYYGLPPGEVIVFQQQKGAGS